MVTSPTFIPGYKATVILNADNISAIGSVVSLSKTRNLLPKPTFGNEYQHSLGGQKLGTFSANGHVSAEQVADLDAAFSSDAPIPFSLQIGDAAGPTDAGLYEGDCVLSDFTLEANADGEWDWSIEATTSGAITYTPAAP
jgi:predicted secreted protein